MDKLLKPEKLTASPNAVNADKVYLHWHKTFENFVNVCASTPPVTAGDLRVPATDAVKLQALLNNVSHELFAMISDADTYEDAIGVLKAAYVRPVNEVYVRHCLATRRQQQGESVDEYLQALNVLSNECTFTEVSAAEYKQEYIRDAFIRGISSREIQSRLLEKAETKENIISLARALEMSMKNSASMQGPNEEFCASLADQAYTLSYSDQPASDQYLAATHHSSKHPSSKPPSSNCYFCGYDRHPRAQCPARLSNCDKCGATGHYARACRTSKRNNGHSSGKQANTRVIAGLIPPSISRAVINSKVNKTLTANTLVDTGSSCTFVDHNFILANGIQVVELTGQNISMASSNHSSKIRGYVTIDLEFAGHSYDQSRVMILDNLCTDIIIGHDIMSLHSSVIVKFGGVRPALEVESECPDSELCAVAVARIESPPLFLHLPPDAQPIMCKSRRFGESDKEFIGQEISKLLDEGIIEPCHSSWRAQVLVTKNERQKRRMVVDYSRTVNKFTPLDAYPQPNLEEMAHTVAKSSVFSAYDLKSAYHQVALAETDKPFTAFEAAGKLYQFNRIPFGVTNGVAAFQRAMDKLIEDEKLEKTYAYLDNITVCGDDQLDHDSNVRHFKVAVKKYQLTLNEDKTISSVSEISMLGYCISHGRIRPDPERMRPLLELPVPESAVSLKRALGLFSYYSQWVSQFSDRIQPLINEPEFPLGAAAIDAFEDIKKLIADGSLVSPNKDDLLVVETDASGFALAGTLNQGGKPIAFFSRTLSKQEKSQSSIEKEAAAVIECCRRWRHYLSGRRFLLITDQQAVSFIFSKERSKATAKNEKLMRWRLELSSLDFDIKYRPGVDNEAADCFSRVHCAALSQHDPLYDIHESLCHPGETRMIHYVRSNNLPYSIAEVKGICSRCSICAKLKPRFYKPSNPPLIHATRPMERLSMDFKGPLPSSTKTRYILTVVDEYSRFPFAFPCSDIDANTVVRCLTEIFTLFGEPGFVHSDRGKQFISSFVKSFLMKHRIGSSHSAAYNPKGNGQCERYNGIIWRTVRLALRSRGLDIDKWQVVLPEALHSIRSLLCTATNETPHQRFLGYSRRHSLGPGLPAWLQEKGKVLLKKHVKNSKYEDDCDEVDLIECNPNYARVRLDNGYEKSVSLRDLAPLPRSNINPATGPVITHNTDHIAPNIAPQTPDPVVLYQGADNNTSTDAAVSLTDGSSESEPPLPRRSGRACSQPERLNYSELGGS